MGRGIQAGFDLANTQVLLGLSAGNHSSLQSGIQSARSKRQHTVKLSGPEKLSTDYTDYTEGLRAKNFVRGP